LLGAVCPSIEQASEICGIVNHLDFSYLLPVPQRIELRAPATLLGDLP
jgi:hypothetical protein